MNVLRERIRRTLMNAAIDGKRPGIMTPEETKTFESMYAEIQRNRAEGHSYAYDIPTDLPELRGDHGDEHVCNALSVLETLKCRKLNLYQEITLRFAQS